MQDDIPLTRHKVTIRPIITKKETASKDDSAMDTSIHLSLSSVVTANVLVCSACTNSKIRNFET